MSCVSHIPSKERKTSITSHSMREKMGGTQQSLVWLIVIPISCWENVARSSCFEGDSVPQEWLYSPLFSTAPCEPLFSFAVIWFCSIPQLVDSAGVGTVFLSSVSCPQSMGRLLASFISASVSLALHSLSENTKSQT